MAHILPHGIKKIKNLLREREREREEKEQDLLKRIDELNGPSYFEYWMLKSQKTEVKGFLKEFEL